MAKKRKPTSAPTKRRGIVIGTHIIKPRKKK